MHSVAIKHARQAILKLDTERQALPLRVLEVFGTLFESSNYNGTYKWSNAGGAHYFIFDGIGKLNRQYRIEIELYWDEINFTLYRSLTRKEKFFDFIQLIGTSLFILLWVVLIIGAFTGDSDGPAGTGTGKGSAAGKNTRSFLLRHSVAAITPGTTLSNRFTAATFEAVLNEHHDYFIRHLLPCIRGEQWMTWCVNKKWVIISICHPLQIHRAHCKALPQLCAIVLLTCLFLSDFCNFRYLLI